MEYVGARLTPTLVRTAVITSTHSRIMWWTCLEAAVLLALSVWQLAFLKRTLEVRRLL